MSDAAGEPAVGTDHDAWATACEEDLAAERERRRAEYGPQPVSAADELRKLADTAAAKVAELGKPFGGAAGGFAAQGVAQQLITQARSVVEPVVERNPQFFDHLAAAGGELFAAYRSATRREEERHWTVETLRAEDAAEPGESGDPRGHGGSDDPREGEGGADSTERPDDPRG